MTRDRLHVLVFAVAASLLLSMLASPAAGQEVLTGTITGRATDASNALIPGVEVSVSSPSMIGGVRTMITDEQGVYRFTQLAAPGVYRVTFALPGFRTLNIDGVNVAVGATMTINGTMEVGGVSEELTVTSQAPTIDLEAATMSINMSSQLLDKLPYQRDIKGIGALIPGFFQTQFDVAGSSMGNGAGTSTRTHGRTGGDQVTYDGVFFSTIFPHYDTYEEVQVSAAAKGAEAYNSGASINFIVKSGSNDFRGSGFAAYQDGAFQSNNVNQKLLDRGYSRTGSNKFTEYYDLFVDTGGPIKRDKLWFYAAYYHKYSGQLVPGFIDHTTGEQVPYFIRLKGPTLKLNYQLTEKMQLEAVAQPTHKIHAYWFASQFVPRESTQRLDSWQMVGPKLKWTYILSPKMTVDASVQRGGFWAPSFSYTDAVRRVDLTTGYTRGMHLAEHRRPIRWIWTGTWSWFTDIGGRNHEIKSGFLGWWDKQFNEFYGITNQQEYRYRSVAGDSNHFLRPNSVLVYDYPITQASGHNYNSWYLNDKITINRNLTINAGIRFDRTSSWLPEQGNPGTGPFATRSLFPERRDFPVYNSWVPRASLVYDVTGQGSVVVKASYGRYYTAGPLAATVNPAVLTTWNYSNWDGRIPYVPRPQDLASVSGGGGVLANRRLDPKLDNSYMDEYSAGIEFGFSRESTFRFNVIRKLDYGGSKTLDLARPFSAYTDVRYATDPGRDNIVGTADDGIMQAWSVPRSYPTFSRIDQLVTNYDKGEGNSQYTAYDATFNKQFANKWSLMASYAATYGKRGNPYPQNPNELVYNWQLPEWYHIVRLNGTYDLPWGLSYAATYFAQSGEYFPRETLMRNALDSIVRVRTEGQSGRYDSVKMWDSRFSKTFRINDRHSLEATLDYYNLLNTNVVLTQTNTNGPDYLKPQAQTSSSVVPMPIIPPRVFRLGARWRF